MEPILLNNIRIAGRGDELYDIFISGGKICRISVAGHGRPDTNAGTPDGSSAQTVDCRGKVAVPGLINMHTHAAMTLMRGMGEDVAFHQWLKRIWEVETRVDEEYVYWGTKVACLEMAKTGTTSFFDHYWFSAAARKAAEEVGIGCEILEFAGSIGENALLESVAELNDNPHINGIIVQQPLPKQINPQKILEAISPDKDVDGFGALNIGKTALKESGAVSAATPKGIIRLLDKYCGDLRGKHAVIIGRSNIVGRPLAALLLNHDCTVTVAHTKTRNLADLVRTADIVVAACGQPKLVKKDWLKKGAVVIDVGINRVGGRLCGDVDFENAAEVCSFISPVPRGVGPMTVAMLLENTFEAFNLQRRKG